MDLLVAKGEFKNVGYLASREAGHQVDNWSGRELAESVRSIAMKRFILFPPRYSPDLSVSYSWWLLNAGDALVITQMIVPSHVQRGSDAVLRCLYDLDGDSLYSVKWYKGSHGTYF